MRIRIRMVGLAVLTASVFGLGTVAAEKARAYVTRKPDGAYAPLAFRFAVEMEARRLVDAGDRRHLVGDLVFRPAGKTKVVRIYGELGGGSTSEGKELREPLRGPPRSAVREAQQALLYLEVRLKRLQRDTTRCDRIRRKRPYLDCLADAMDQFAVEVESMPRTPASVAPVAVPVLRETARRIRAAETIPEAQAAVADGIAEIRKSIALVQAGGEDQLQRLELGQRSVVLKAMAVVDTSLVQAVGI
jgi:hypothetical protein